MTYEKIKYLLQKRKVSLCILVSSQNKFMLGLPIITNYLGSVTSYLAKIYSQDAIFVCSGWKQVRQNAQDVLECEPVLFTDVERVRRVE